MKKTFIVNRKKWNRGADSYLYGSGFLLNDRNNMCCMGFFAKQILKLNDNKIKDKEFIAKRDNKHVVSRHDQKGFFSIYRINDDDFIDDVEREALLKKAFKRLGFDIRFRG